MLEKNIEKENSWVCLLNYKIYLKIVVWEEGNKKNSLGKKCRNWSLESSCS